MAPVIILAVLSGCTADMQDATGYRLNWNAADGRLMALAPAPNADERIKATASTHPDERREAVIWLSHPRRCSLPNVVALLGAMVQQDEDPTVRAAAARGLGRSNNPDAVEPLIAALNDADNVVRCDACAALAGKVGDNVKGALLVRLAGDSQASVRSAAAAGLVHYRERRVLESLIAALRDPDFAVVHSAEQALIFLTGRTFDYKPDEWNRWLTGLAPHDDPFALAGRPPQSMQNLAPPLSERFRDFIRDSWYWWQADEKAPD